MAMRGYGGYEYNDLDEYEEEEGEEGEEEESGEEEYEEEKEAPQPTQEELEYLELRQRLKEDIRKQMKNESGSALVNTQERKKKFPYENFGSFFGPSQPVISQRVIQESKSMLENLHLASKVSKFHHEKNKSSASTATGSKAQVQKQRPKVVNELKMKVQKLKNTRDYSFLLSDDAELPASTKDQPLRNVTAPSSALLPPKRKETVTKTGSQAFSGREERRPVSTGSQRHPKAGAQRPTSVSKPVLASLDSRKQLGNSNGSGPGRPLGLKQAPSKMTSSTTDRRISATGAKSSLPSVQKPPLSKFHSSASKQPTLSKQPSLSKQPLDRKKESQESSKGKMPPKQLVPPSKTQINKKTPAKLTSRPVLREERPKKKPARPFSDDEGEEPFSIIRKMFRYNPKKFQDEDDDSDMEANFDDIMREEKRSARLGRMEDEEELRKIEEEERRERLRKEAKKRKLSQR